MYTQYQSVKDRVDLYHVDNLKNPFVLLRHLLKLRVLAKKYDIAHAQYGSAVGFLTSLMGCTRILSLKGSDWYVSPSTSLLEKLRILMGIQMTRISLKRFHHIIVMSDAMKKEVLKSVPGAEVETITDPIDLDKFKPSRIPAENKVKKVLFAAVHLDNPVKRFSLAQRSFELLRKKLPNTELVTMSRIPHSEVCNFMNGMDVLLLTSTHEGWPNVVKEMLACNKPFVSTQVSDLEAYAARTKNCFVCNDSPQELADALYKSLRAPEEDLRRLVRDFNLDESLSALKKIYDKYL
ncbi:glycosyltransferase family 4 protein [Flavobacteriaceae bacterium TP-CH-4]|uniref:Glycosyltransferase family 4 protein n=2 Tax=Pelagihabitans pacificus TaxID=2696054 RepID=A0A967B0X4_9FLAO|nr:glycosyltransferase family 4 protein [Pelagihabitans pacificus]